MTVREYRTECIKHAVLAGKPECDGHRVFSFLEDALEIWSNEACLGYVVEALQTESVERDDINRIVSAVKAEFERMSVDEAVQSYCQSKY